VTCTRTSRSDPMDLPPEVRAAREKRKGMRATGDMTPQDTDKYATYTVAIGHVKVGARRTIYESERMTMIDDGSFFSLSAEEWQAKTSGTIAEWRAYGKALYDRIRASAHWHNGVPCADAHRKIRDGVPS
jgi:hypothetical protein